MVQPGNQRRNTHYIENTTFDVNVKMAPIGTVICHVHDVIVHIYCRLSNQIAADILLA